MIFSEKSETPNLTDYLKAKPDSVVYYGDKKSTASWQLLYFIALKLIAAKHPDELMRLERKSILGDKIEIGSEIEIREFSHPLGIMRKPDGKWLFAETDFNVQQILLRLKKLMEICKDPLDTMVIYCLNPAIEMRSAIYKQLCIIDAKEYDVPSKRIPEIVCK